MRKSSFTDPAKPSHCPLLRSMAVLAISRQRCSGTVVKVMSMRRHSMGSPTATLHHAVQAHSVQSVLQVVLYPHFCLSGTMFQFQILFCCRFSGVWSALCTASKHKGMPNVPCALKNLSFVKHACSRVLKASHLPAARPTAASFTTFSASRLMECHVIVSEIGVKCVTTKVCDHLTRPATAATGRTRLAHL
jgi:hypothetical protein